jgi:predicted NUDIX family NTP pyrophosphohydrolase
VAELISAGLLMYNLKGNELQLFLVHPGGPFFKKKDEGYWGIPKGLIEKNEDLFTAAKREFEEETGIAPVGEFIPLDFIIQKSRKKVYAWAFAAKDNSPIQIKCNNFEIEWPPHSGKKQSFPEVDRGEFFSFEDALKKINASQIEFINRLKKYLSLEN